MKIRLFKIYTKKKIEKKTINGQTRNVLITKIIVTLEYREGEVDVIELMYDFPVEQTIVYKKVISVHEINRIIINHAYRCCVYDSNKSIQSLVKKDLYIERILPKGARDLDDDKLFLFVYNEILYKSIYSLSRKHRSRLEKILDRVRENN